MMQQSESTQVSSSVDRRSLRKSVSLPPPPAIDGPIEHSPAHDKILARKPTPFNSGLAQMIKNSGIREEMLGEQEDNEAGKEDTNGNANNTNDSADNDEPMNDSGQHQTANGNGSVQSNNKSNSAQPNSTQ